MGNLKRAVFEFERETKNTVRFNERVEPMGVPVIGILYVQKATLQQLEYRQGDDLVVTLTAPHGGENDGK
jgi:hypothetical protein